MTTYSDRTRTLRLFLGAHRAVPTERMERPSGELQEKWMVKDTEIIVRINADGEWDAFISVSPSKAPEVQLRGLEKIIQGKRPDLDLLEDVEKMARAFQDAIRDLPGCSDPACLQQACKELRDLRGNIETFLNRTHPKERSNATA